MAASQYTTQTVPVEQYLRGCVGYNVTDEAILSILLNRGVESATPADSVDRKSRELCIADLYMWCASNPSTSSVVEDADAGWKHREGGSSRTNADLGRLIDMANAIYKKYGENTSTSSIRMHNYGIKLWRR